MAINGKAVDQLHGETKQPFLNSEVEFNQCEGLEWADHVP